MPEFIPVHSTESAPRWSELDEFTRDYLTAAEWLLDGSADENGVSDYDRAKGWSREAVDQAERVCKNFQEANEVDLAVYRDKIGHAGGVDFWLTRNHHGAGFWDRGLGEVGKRLTDAAHGYGECDTYVGDDGLIYFGG